jgi:hypothetical protein
MCSAVSEDEQDVSSATLGPSRSKVYDTRLAIEACIAGGATGAPSTSW